MNPAAPLIVTALLPADLQSWANALRKRHFPPERNFLDAHVTLFHALPPSCAAELVDLLAGLCSTTPACPARLAGVMSLGRGTALHLSSPALLALRDNIADCLHGMLSAQDIHRPKLHITV